MLPYRNRDFGKEKRREKGEGRKEKGEKRKQKREKRKGGIFLHGIVDH